MTSDGSGNNFWGWNVSSKQKWYSTSSTAPTCGTNGKCLIYDAFGHIVAYTTTTAYIDQWQMQGGALATLSASSLETLRIPAPGGGGLVEVNPNTGGYNYLHGDWLGNARVLSSVVNNTEYDDRAYTPYGEQFTSYGLTATVYQMFAGMTADFNNGIQYETPNREFSVVGRWLSPDPAGLGAVDMANPQTWNRYAYVAANPLSAVDPTGLGELPTGAACRNSANAGSPNCVRYSADCTQAAGFCPPESMNNDEFGLLLNGGCAEECQYERNIGWRFTGTLYGKPYNQFFSSLNDYANWRTGIAALPESQVYETFMAACQYLAGCDPSAQYTINAQLRGFTQNIQVLGPDGKPLPLDVGAAAGDASHTGIGHGGNDSWYIGGMYDVLHVVNVQIPYASAVQGGEVHIDEFSPYGLGAPLHLIDYAASFLIKGASVTFTCSASGGCN